MDRLVALQSQAQTVAANGERTGAWTTYATVWAEERELPSGEVVVSGTEQAQKTMIFFVRFRTDITERHRVSYGGSDFDIENIREIGRREGLELRCRRHAG